MNSLPTRSEFGYCRGILVGEGGDWMFVVSGPLLALGYVGVAGVLLCPFGTVPYWESCLGTLTL